MKLSMILVMTICQFSIEAKLLYLESTDLSIQENCAGQVTYVQVFEMGNQLVVVWQPPNCDIGDAQVKYIVEYATANAIQTVETEETFHYFDYTANICFDNEITITPVLDDIPGSPYNTIYNTRLGEVANVYAKHANNIVNVKWEAPLGSDCDLDYLITLKTSSQTETLMVVNTFDVDIENIYMKPCENATVAITPIRGEIVGSALNRNIQGEIGPVTNIVTDDEAGGDDIFLDFDEPENADLCNLKYAIRYGPTVCYERNASITVFNKFGDARHTSLVTVKEKIGPVNNLTVIRLMPNNLIEIIWDAIETERDECPVTYEVIYESRGSFVLSKITPELSMMIAGSHMCPDLRVSVSPIVGNVIGTNSTISLPSVCEEMERDWSLERKLQNIW